MSEIGRKLEELLMCSKVKAEFRLHCKINIKRLWFWVLKKKLCFSKLMLISGQAGYPAFMLSGTSLKSMQSTCKCFFSLSRRRDGRGRLPRRCHTSQNTFSTRHSFSLFWGRHIWVFGSSLALIPPPLSCNFRKITINENFELFMFVVYIVT